MLDPFGGKADKVYSFMENAIAMFSKVKRLSLGAKV